MTAPATSSAGAVRVRLARADAVDVARHVAPKSAMLAYLDPPFAVGTTFRTRAGDAAYDDRWPSLDAYLAWLGERVAAVREVLSEAGTMWLHLDHRATHEAKVACDRIFGRA